MALNDRFYKIEVLTWFPEGFHANKIRVSSQKYLKRGRNFHAKAPRDKAVDRSLEMERRIFQNF